MEKIPLSVVIVTKNEEKVIGRCIDSIRDIADEILVIDSGSEDNTVEIAKEKGARVIKRKWPGYPKQVQYGIDTAKNDFVLVLDADEEVSKDLKISIIENVKNPKDFSCFSLKRKTFYLGKFLEHTWYPEWRIRLFKKDKVRYEGYLHETVLCDGKVGNLSGDLYHYSFKSLRHQFLKAIEYADTASQELFEKGKRASFKHLFLNPLWSFIKNFIINRGFLDGKRGFIASVYMSFYTFMKYAFLYEKRLRNRYGNDLWKR